MKNLLPLALCTFCLMGCETNDAIHTTAGLGAKMDQMNNTTQDMRAKTTDMNSKMDATNRGVHLQELEGALKREMSDDSVKGYQFPSIPPALLAARAETFALEANAEETMKFIYVSMENYNDSKNILEKNLTAGMLSFVALMAPNLMLDPANEQERIHPHSLVDEIIRKQLKKGRGRYDKQALAFLALRVFYTIDAFHRLTDLHSDGRIVAAYSYLSELQYIINLSHSTDMKISLADIQISLPGTLDTYVVNKDTLTVIKDGWNDLLKELDKKERDNRFLEKKDEFRVKTLKAISELEDEIKKM